jgi:hypothetical protein
MQRGMRLRSVVCCRWHSALEHPRPFKYSGQGRTASGGWRMGHWANPGGQTPVLHTIETVRLCMQTTKPSGIAVTSFILNDVKQSNIQCYVLVSDVSVDSVWQDSELVSCSDQEIVS